MTDNSLSRTPTVYGNVRYIPNGKCKFPRAGDKIVWWTEFLAPRILNVGNKS